MVEAAPAWSYAMVNLEKFKKQNPVLYISFLLLSETKQNAETGETTSQGVASGATLITNGLHEDLPAPPPELIVSKKVLVLAKLIF